MKKARTVVTMLLLTLPLVACQSFARRAPLPVAAEDNTLMLQQHPQFRAAAQAAPEFVKETFHVIHRLEKEKANGQQ